VKPFLRGASGSQVHGRLLDEFEQARGVAIRCLRGQVKRTAPRAGIHRLESCAGKCMRQSEEIGRGNESAIGQQ